MHIVFLPLMSQQSATSKDSVTDDAKWNPSTQNTPPSSRLPMTSAASSTASSDTDHSPQIHNPNLSQHIATAAHASSEHDSDDATGEGGEENTPEPASGTPTDNRQGNNDQSLKKEDDVDDANSEALTIFDNEDWFGGDISLRSSDGVRFRTRSHLLA